jgi:hypothetical protein
MICWSLSASSGGVRRMSRLAACRYRPGESAAFPIHAFIDEREAAG